ncbi:globin [Aurantivibrio plasticivorans]
MSASIAEIFNDSYQRMSDRYRDQFYECFYSCFISKDPRVAEAFVGVDMERQKSMLEDSLMMLLSCAATGETSESLQSLARVHSKLHIPADLFALWMDSLVEALERVDPSYKPADGLAWRAMFMPGVEYMIAHVSAADQ